MDWINICNIAGHVVTDDGTVGRVVAESFVLRWIFHYSSHIHPFCDKHRIESILCAGWFLAKMRCSFYLRLAAWWWWSSAQAGRNEVIHDHIHLIVGLFPNESWPTTCHRLDMLHPGRWGCAEINCEFQHCDEPDLLLRGANGSCSFILRLVGKSNCNGWKLFSSISFFSFLLLLLPLLPFFLFIILLECVVVVNSPLHHWYHRSS